LNKHRRFCDTKVSFKAQTFVLSKILPQSDARTRYALDCGFGTHKDAGATLHYYRNLS
jgi:hypothetical protein